MNTRITLTRKEIKRLKVMLMLEEKIITRIEVAGGQSGLFDAAILLIGGDWLRKNCAGWQFAEYGSRPARGDLAG